MARRLPLIRQAPKRWLDWQPRTGGLAGLSLVKKQYPHADAIAVQPQSLDLQWLKKAQQISWWRPWKLSHQSYSNEKDFNADMVWSNLLLHQHADPLGLMKAWSRALNSQGFVMFSCLGPDTLQELRELYRRMKWPMPHHAFTDMHDWGDMLLKAGFSQPVMDMERITLTYEDAENALKDLRSWGRNLNPDRFSAMRGSRWREQLCAEMNQQLRSGCHEGRLGLSFEIIYGHAFKAALPSTVSVETRLPLQDVKQMLQAHKTGSSKP
jgi:malonyl-CoA O-methyltransferase